MTHAKLNDSEMTHRRWPRMKSAAKCWIQDWKNSSYRAAELQKARWLVPGWVCLLLEPSLQASSSHSTLVMLYSGCLPVHICCDCIIMIPVQFHSSNPSFTTHLPLSQYCLSWDDVDHSAGRNVQVFLGTHVGQQVFEWTGSRTCQFMSFIPVYKHVFTFFP